MSEHQGRFVWYELTTTDADAATAFYTDVVGWTAETSDMGGGFNYTLLKVGERQVAGLMVLPPEMPGAKMPPRWTGYIAVDDVDAAAKKVEDLGGFIFKPADDIPKVGRFAIAGDPGGAGFALFKGDPGEEMFEPAPMDKPGFCAWHELIADDLDRDLAFYSALVGWRAATAMDMGEMGVYQMFARAQGAGDLGGMMNKTPDQAAAMWNYYFMTPDIDAAADRVKAGGGQVIMGPMQVPGGLWAMLGVDPQGAVFGLVGPRL